MSKVKGVISEEEWGEGKSAGGSMEKASAVLKVLQEVKEGAVTMEYIQRKCGLKWPYSTVKALVKAGTIEQKKIGKALFYRLKRKVA